MFGWLKRRSVIQSGRGRINPGRFWQDVLPGRHWRPAFRVCPIGQGCAVIVAIDGCQTGCTKAILKNNQVPLKNYLVITDEVIEKNKNFRLERADIDRVKAASRRVVSRSVQADIVSSAEGCGCTSCC